MTSSEATYKSGPKGPVTVSKRKTIIASLRGALAGGPSLTSALEAGRRLEREREERKSAGMGR